MLNVITNVVSWISKNAALIIGIVESILKAVAGIVSITPTKKDDKVYEIVDKVFSKVKKYLYDASDFLEKFGK